MTVAKFIYRGLKAVAAFLASGAMALRPELDVTSVESIRWSVADEEAAFQWSVADDAAAWLYANT